MPASTPTFTILKPDRLMDGRDSPTLTGVSVLLEDDRIRAVGPDDRIAFPDGANGEVLEFPGGTLLPGLIDCHTHTNMPGTGRRGEDVNREDTDAIRVLRSAHNVAIALQTGVIDGPLTSLGGFNNTKEQAPYFTVAGINGIVGDYYWIGASLSWWNSLSDEQRTIIENLLVNDVIPFQKQMNWCNDRRLVDKFETKDPSKPGIYIMNADEAGALRAKLGNATADWVKANTPDDANPWVDKFVEEATAATAANPMGSDPLEETDCGEMAKYFAKYVKK